MKKRNRQVDPEVASPIRTSFPTLVDGLRSFNHRSSKDVSREKRLKLVDIDDDDDPSFNLHEPPLPREGIQDPKSYGPKTSEYDFFKKLKSDAGQRLSFHSMHKEKDQSRKIKSTESREEGTNIKKSSSVYREGTNIIRNSFKDFRSPLPVENVRHGGFESLLSPHDRAAKNSEVNLKKAFSAFADKCSMWKRNEEDSDSLRTAVSQSKQADIFSEKRQKLLQWVADNSFPEMDKLFSKRYDLVSMLLSRLSSGNNEKKSFKISEPSVKSANSNLLDFPNSEILLKKIHQIPTENFMEIECTPYLEKSPSYRSYRSSENLLSNSESPTANALNTLLQKDSGEPSCQIGRRKAISCLESDSTFGIPFVKYSSLPPFNPLKELDDFHDFSGSLLETNAPSLLLGWNFRNMTNERNLSVTYANTDLNKYSSALCSWDNQRNVNSEFESVGKPGFCTSSVLTNNPENFYSLIPICSAGYQQQEFEGYNFEETKDSGAHLNHLPLALSCTSRYLNLIEDFNSETTCKGSDFFFVSPESHQWSMRELSSEAQDRDPGTKSACVSLGLGAGWKCFSSSGSASQHYSSTCQAFQFPQKEIISSPFLTEDEYKGSLHGSSYRKMLNHFNGDMIPDLSSFYFQMSLEKEKARPLLLLDKSSREESAGETYYDDDNEVKYQ